MILMSNYKTKGKDRTNYSGIYRLDCEEDNMTFIRETGQKFIRRMKKIT